VAVVLLLAGVVWWRRTGNWLILGLMAAPLSILVGHLALRSPETARIDRIESCGIMVTGTATSGYSIMLIWNRSDEVIEEAYDDLRALPKVDYATVRSKNVTDKGVALLARLPDLEVMDLGSVRLSQRGSQCLSHIPRLRRLELGAVECRDDDLAGLCNSTSLEMLAVRDCGLGDGAMEYVARIKPLRRVDFVETAVSAEAVANLRTKRPDLSIVHVPTRPLPRRSPRASVKP
jgi:hypothetical protein